MENRCSTVAVGLILALIAGPFVIGRKWLIFDYFTGLTENVVFWI